MAILIDHIMEDNIMKMNQTTGYWWSSATRWEMEDGQNQEIISMEKYIVPVNSEIKEKRKNYNFQMLSDYPNPKEKIANT